MTLKKNQELLIEWYRENQRPLPWRKKRDPYRIWVSEVMLQQTTVTAVIPYYENFIQKFPTLKDLAQASEGQVLKSWAGLGYYSRARNLHKSAQILNKKGFPRSHKELIKLPGFGPYTSRAVTSIAFGEETGVLDGNVIRVLSRKNALHTEWWKPKGRQQLQEIADRIVLNTPANETNQALMELGATICTPSSPSCLLCPWRKSCQSYKKGNPQDYPYQKPKRKREFWHWKVNLITQKNKIALLPNDYTPFLKKQWLCPGNIQQLKTRPKSFDFKHSITHHDIYVSVENSYLKNLSLQQRKACQWIEIKNISEIMPASLIKKVLNHIK